MCEYCEEHPVVDRGLCAACLTYAYEMEFWDLIGDDADLIKFDEQMIEVDIEHFRTALDATD